jgi:hypothetical protein
MEPKGSTSAEWTIVALEEHNILDAVVTGIFISLLLNVSSA